MTPDTSSCSYSLGNCGTIAAIPYFITYILIVSIILLNLFTAVIIETFEATHNQVRRNSNSNQYSAHRPS